MSKIPAYFECLQLLKKYKVPQNVIAHCIKVNEVAMLLARKIAARGEKINLELVDAASLLHDIDKVLDNNGENHGKLSRQILEKEGFPEVGKLAEKHIMHTILKENGLLTLEEKIVFYADKRVNHDKIVSIEERFRYYRKTYPQYIDTMNHTEPLVNELENELMEKAGIRAEEIK